MSAKRKHVRLTLEEKIDAIRRVEKDETIKKVAQELGVGAVTVGDWLRNWNKLEEWISQRTSQKKIDGTKRKTMKSGVYEKISQALFLWFIQMRQKGSPILGPILLAKAKDLNNMFPEESSDFTASLGWLDR